MMKQEFTKKGTKVFAGIVAAAMVMGSLTACGGTKEPVESPSAVSESSIESTEATEGSGTADDAQSSTMAGEVNEVEESVTCYGEITAIDNNNVTLALGDTAEQADATLTITVDAETIITSNGEMVVLEELKIGDKVTALMQGEKVNSLIVEEESSADAEDSEESDINDASDVTQ